MSLVTSMFFEIFVLFVLLKRANYSFLHTNSLCTLCMWNTYVFSGGGRSSFYALNDRRLPKIFGTQIWAGVEVVWNHQRTESHIPKRLLQNDKHYDSCEYLIPLSLHHWGAVTEWKLRLIRELGESFERLFVLEGDCALLQWRETPETLVSNFPYSDNRLSKMSGFVYTFNLPWFCTRLTLIEAP